MRSAVVYLFIFLIIPSVVLGQTDEARKKNFNIKKGVAIEGYDPVSYFDGNPKEGKQNLSFTYKGVRYLFSTPANVEKFKLNPAAYEPAFGGWCAFAMGDSGEEVKIDPETYKIQGGKLYLFYNFWGNNTLTDWNKNETGLMKKGDINWSRILK